MLHYDTELGEVLVEDVDEEVVPTHPNEGDEESPLTDEDDDFEDDDEDEDEDEDDVEVPVEAPIPPPDDED